jgi:mRNA interferase MazF
VSRGGGSAWLPPSSCSLRLGLAGFQREPAAPAASALLGLSTLVICPTSLSGFGASFHPEIDVGGKSTRVLCEMVGAVDARALGRQAGHLSQDDLRAVEDALLLVLDMH